MYPFGYGLSYSEFRYGEVEVSPEQWNAAGAVTVTVDVTNTGSMDADEVVQLYVTHNDVENSPIRTLAGFERVHIPKGETRQVSFELDGRRLSIVDEKGQRAVIPAYSGEREHPFRSIVNTGISQRITTAVF